MYISERIYYMSLKEMGGSIKHLEILWEVNSCIIAIVIQLLIISLPCFEYFFI